MIDLRFRDIWLVLVSVALGVAVPAVAQDKVLSMLAAIAAFAGVVVTVFGIWIAMVFPQLLAGLSSGSSVRDLPERGTYRALVVSLYRSCFVLCAVLFVTIAVTLYGESQDYLVKALAVFGWLSFFSVTAALWGVVAGGERTVVGQINAGILEGVRRRLRRKPKQ